MLSDSFSVRTLGSRGADPPSDRPASPLLLSLPSLPASLPVPLSPRSQLKRSRVTSRVRRREGRLVWRRRRPIEGGSRVPSRSRSRAGVYGAFFVGCSSSCGDGGSESASEEKDVSASLNLSPASVLLTDRQPSRAFPPLHRKPVFPRKRTPACVCQQVCQRNRTTEARGRERETSATASMDSMSLFHPITCCQHHPSSDMRHAVY